MEETIRKSFEEWKEKASADPDLRQELDSMEENAVNEAFYTQLSFGTAGLRGIIGAGTNRMNVYTVARASRAMAKFARSKNACPSAAIAYDSRIKSELFARTAAAVFAEEGVKVHLFDELEPTPCLSFAVRYFSCDVGVMVTASHNPAAYNGYKAYGSDGCQMTEEHAGEVYRIMQTIPVLQAFPEKTFEASLQDGSIEWIGEEVMEAYLENVRRQSVVPENAAIDRNVSIVYTPLNGAGRKPVLEILRRSGFTNVTVVKEQEEPDGRFPTCPYPNPEIYEAMDLGIRTCKEANADLLIATDPDSDRLSVAVRKPDGEYRILSGNEFGSILLSFLIEKRKESGTLPDRPVAVKSIVTTELAEAIAESENVEMRNVLTGFKYIGEQIGLLEKAHEEERFVFGFEESCGFLSGSYVRDKDAVVASMLAAEMFASLKSEGKSLLDRLSELEDRFGHFKNAVHQLSYPGIEGKKTMARIMESLRNAVDSFGSRQVVSMIDYLEGKELPPSDVLEFRLTDGDKIIVRPSGTEPKIKVYVTAVGKTGEEAEAKAQTLFELAKERLADES